MVVSNLNFADLIDFPHPPYQDVTFQEVHTEYGDVQSASTHTVGWGTWVDAHSEVDISDEAPHYNPNVNGDNGERYVFYMTSAEGSPVVREPGEDDPYYITIAYDKDYEITFAIDPAGGGTTNPAGIAWWGYSGLYYDHTIVATANPGYIFDHWEATPDNAAKPIVIEDVTLASTRARTEGSGTITAVFRSLGTTLAADIAATPYWTRTFSWTIGKSVDPDTWNLFVGDTVTSHYTITLTKDGGTNAAYIEGNVDVENTGPVTTENLAITVQVKYGGSIVGTDALIVGGELDASDSDSYSYHVDIALGDLHEGGSYDIIAYVTITNYQGNLGSAYGPEQVPRKL